MTDAERLEQIKRNFNNTLIMLGRSNGKTQLLEDITWLFEQAEKTVQYKHALENISDVLEGQNVTELVESIAYELGHSGIYDKDIKE